MNPTESLSQGLQIGEKAVYLHPVIDGFRVLLFTFWMNSFAFPWKEHNFFKYITYLWTQRGLFSISALRSSLSFTALLKQSLTTSWSPWPRMKCLSQRFSSSVLLAVSIILFIVLHRLVRKSSPFHFFSFVLIIPS